jgi:hypothetical protein
MDIKNRHGVTLAIALGIVVIIIGVTWFVMSPDRNQEKAKQEILTIRENVRALYATRQTIDRGDLTSDMIAAKVFPSEMLVDGVPQDPWGNTVAVGSQMNWDFIPDSPSSFEILVGYPAESVTPAKCGPELINIVNSDNARAGLTYLGAGGGDGSPTIQIAGGPFEITPDGAVPAKSTLIKCTGHFTLQYSLQ